MDLTTALGIVKRAANQERLRLKRGLMRRQQMVEALERGEEPTGPRADWLRETAMEVIRTLEQQAAKFNAACIDDMVSLPDLGDALNTALGMLKDAGLE